MTSATERSLSGSSTQRPPDRRLAGLVFALLVLACFFAFFLTQHLKHTPTAVQKFRLTPFFSPTPAGHIKQERISFSLADADEVTITIVDSSNAVVAILLRAHPVERYKQLSLRWSGRRGAARGFVLVPGPNGQPALEPRLAGPLAKAGKYRVRVSLRKARRTVDSPRSFTLVSP